MYIVYNIYIYTYIIYNVYTYICFFNWNAKPLPIRVVKIRDQWADDSVCVFFGGDLGGDPILKPPEFSWFLLGKHRAKRRWIFCWEKFYPRKKKTSKPLKRRTFGCCFVLIFSQGEALGLMFFLASLVAAQENDNRSTWMAQRPCFESLAFSVSLVVVMLYSVTAIVYVDIYIPHLLQHIMPSYELCHQIVIQKVQVSSLHRPLNSPCFFGQGRQCTLPQNCLHQQPIRSTQVKWSLAENPLRTWEPRAPVRGTHGTHTTQQNPYGNGWELGLKFLGAYWWSSRQ